MTSLRRHFCRVFSFSGESSPNGRTLKVAELFTSSTAQGSGGSFKNRKPIGEICCCESGMAERNH